MLLLLSIKAKKNSSNKNLFLFYQHLLAFVKSCSHGPHGVISCRVNKKCVASKKVKRPSFENYTRYYFGVDHEEQKKS